jgi:hypothetical protein
MRVAAGKKIYPPSRHMQWYILKRWFSIEIGLDSRKERYQDWNISTAFRVA